MTASSKSIYYFGIYLVITAISLLAFPNTLLGLFLIAPTTEVWVRVLGVVVLDLAVLYIFMARANSVLFMTLSVYLRLCALGWFILFIALGLAPIQLVFFGLVDAAGALWTYLALRKE